MAVYKIKDLEVLTGIKAHTIRIWEKRYGLLKPDRTETQIRTYTDDELLLLLNISLLYKYGHKISLIAELSEKEITQRVRELTLQSITDTSIEQLIVALIEMNESLFRTVVDELVKKHGMVDTYIQHLIPFLERIGVMWMASSINPAQEHFISNLIRQKLLYELAILPCPDATKPKIILFLPEHEWHELSLLLYHYYLRSTGKNTIYLGQSLPFDSLVQSIELLQPVAIVSAWLTAVDPSYLKHYFNRLRQQTTIQIIAGGFQIQQNAAVIPSEIELFKSLPELNSLLS
jgi:DNA-binding transcriptional MerR regulator